MIMEIFSVKFWLYLISGDCICQIVKAAIEEKRVMRLWFPVLVTTCEVFDLLNLCSACVLLTYFDWKFLFGTCRLLVYCLCELLLSDSFSCILLPVICR